MSRIRAFFIHLSMSTAVGAALFALFWFMWYPAPLFKATGGHHVFLMLLAIDVVLGPLLTLIVFQTGKKSLKIDLLVIGLLQVAALSYGAYFLTIGRPVYVAALGHRFDLVTANEIREVDLIKAGKRLPWFGPEWVGIKPADDPLEKERVMFSALGGADYGHFPQHHAPLQTMRSEILQNAMPLRKLETYNVGRSAEIQAWLAAHGISESNTVFQGLKAHGEDMAVILDSRSGVVLGVAPFKPWD